MLMERIESLSPLKRIKALALLAAETAGFTTPSGEKPPKDWREWLTTLFPQHFYHPLGERHLAFWRWVLDMKVADSPPPFVAAWPRGSGKSTSAEVAVVALGVRGRRKYVLYIRETQEQADKSVDNIAALLESSTVARYYPEHSQRKINKFGSSRGWRRNRLRTAGGLTIDALGLDTAARGVKVEEQRPDLIVCDDIDSKLDSPAITAKKRDTLTHSILPAGSQNVAVLFIQNLIIPDGIATQLTDGRAEYLARRIVSGPFPAMEGLKVEWRESPETGIRRAFIIGGKATWEGQDIAACQNFIDTWGLPAFLKEAQHEVKGRAEGVALRFAPRHLVDMTDDEARDLVQKGRCFGGIDFGAWRFAFTLWCVDRNRIVTRLDEVFAQRIAGQASLTDRARLIHEMCECYGITGRIPIWGDSANPQDILEINAAFKRGWTVTYDNGKFELVTSKLRVVAVMAENKARKVSVERINNALDHNTLRFRREVTYEWRYAMNASNSEGTAMKGSRLTWEMDAWSFPVPKEGEAQDQNPDDDTADGGDMIASARYALMSHWTAAKTPIDLGTYSDDRAEPFDVKARKFKEPPHMVDLLEESGQNRRTPRYANTRARTLR